MSTPARRDFQNGPRCELPEWHHDASDHGVTQINRPTLALPEGHQVSGFDGRSIIERSDSATHFLEDGFKGRQQQRPSFPGRHDLKSKPNLKDCY